MSPVIKMGEAFRLFLSGGIVSALALLAKDVFLIPNGDWIYVLYVGIGLGFYMLVEVLKKIPAQVLMLLGVSAWVFSFGYLVYLIVV